MNTTMERMSRIEFVVLYNSKALRKSRLSDIVSLLMSLDNKKCISTLLAYILPFVSLRRPISETIITQSFTSLCQVYRFENAQTVTRTEITAEIFAWKYTLRVKC